jgi:hypothetical protein
MLLQLRGGSSRNNLKCIWKGNKLELLTPIAFNKSGRKSNKNLKVMTNVINVWQLLK